MPSQDDIPDDDDVRHTYNFAPSNYGLVYRAAVPDHGAGPTPHEDHDAADREKSQDKSTDVATTAEPTQATIDGAEQEPQQSQDHTPTQYKLQSMKWGLVPFWTKRAPDYGSTMRTINCRDDSLATPGGMWNTMKQRKRCIVVAQGFYEWLKKSGGQKQPHYVKRKDGQLMCFAGLWDCAKYEDAEKPLYTYTIITTSSNSTLSFLHDRMPVILDPASDAMNAWLSPTQDHWTKELQSILKPYQGELECYAVPREVGKVGNNSPSFIVPIDSKDNPNNIANFFGSAGAQKTGQATESPAKRIDVKAEKQETRGTTNQELESEDNAPKPMPEPAAGTKHGREETEVEQDTSPATEDGEIEKPAKILKSEHSPSKTTPKITTRSTRSATKNLSPMKSKSPMKAEDGSKKITNFFST